MSKKIQLKEEKIQLKKMLVTRGKADIHRVNYTRYVTFTLPVTAEDLIIEKETDGKKETLRIPLTKEFYEHFKRKKIINKVKIYKRFFQDTKRIEVDLKKEKLTINKKFNLR